MSIKKYVDGTFNKSALPKDAIVIDCTDRDAIELLIEGNTKGPLLRALESNKPIVLDNFAKVKPDTDRALFSVLQFLSGETDEVTIYNPQSTQRDTPFAQYKKSDIGSNFSLSFIAYDTRDLASPVKTRAIPAKNKGIQK